MILYQLLNIYLELLIDRIMQEKIEYDSPIAHIYWDERGFFMFKMKNTNAIYDEEETMRQFDFFITHTDGKPYKVIVDTRESLVFPTDDSFDYFFKHNKSVNKNAVIVNSLPMQLLMGQMYKGSKIKNTQLFKNEDEAIDWLLKD